MSKDEKKATEEKAVEAEATPVEAKPDKTWKIFGLEIKKAEKAPKPEKVELTTDEKKARNKKIVKKVLIGLGCGIALIGGAIVKDKMESEADHPTDDEPEGTTVYQIGPGKDAEPVKVETPANEINAEEKSSD